MKKLHAVMRNLFKVGSFVFMFGFFSTVSANDLKQGDIAPGFSLLNQSANTVSLKDYRGKWVVLYFYPKDDTPGCTTEACSFRDNINRLIARDAVVLGVSLDSQQSHAEFAKNHNLPFDLLADESGQVTKSYGALLDLKVFKYAKRHSFIINPQGHIAKVYRDVNPKQHVRDVLQDLHSLQTQ